jgi:hypothetical protein
LKFPESKYRDWAKKLPPYEAGNRANLLRSKMPEVPGVRQNSAKRA